MIWDIDSVYSIAWLFWIKKQLQTLKGRSWPTFVSLVTYIFQIIMFLLRWLNYCGEQECTAFSLFRLYRFQEYFRSCGEHKRLKIMFALSLSPIVLTLQRFQSLWTQHFSSNYLRCCVMLSNEPVINNDFTSGCVSVCFVLSSDGSGADMRAWSLGPCSGLSASGLRPTPSVTCLLCLLLMSLGHHIRQAVQLFL